MGKIKNFDVLAADSIRRAALRIAEAGLEAIDTENAVKRAVRIDGTMLRVNEHEFDLASVERLYVVGVGKCSLEAGATLEEILGDRITGGIVIDVHQGSLKRIKTYQGTHPLPTEQNMDATKQIIALLKDCGERDLVLFAISGGGSTLLCLPYEALAKEGQPASPELQRGEPTNHLCADEARIFTCLSHAGATIQELNTVRKHLSLARGGFLAQYAYPARGVALIFSDVPGNDVEFIASGPTVKDITAVRDAEKVIAKYDLKNNCGFAAEMLIETPKDDKYFEKMVNVLIVSNEVALRAMADEARRLGFHPNIVTAVMSGEASTTGKDIATTLAKAPPKTVLLYGGETTVTAKDGGGRGGRNLELALAAMEHIGEGELVMSLASDGRDNGPFAGAICDMITKKKADELHADIAGALAGHNSYPFFETVGNYLDTGDTGSNVSDLIIAVKS